MSVAGHPAQPGRDGYVVHSRRDPNTYLMIRDCPLCMKQSQVVIPAQGLWNWEHGTLIQTAFPNLTVVERELVKTGIHGECWDRAFSEPI